MTRTWPESVAARRVVIGVLCGAILASLWLAARTLWAAWIDSSGWADVVALALALWLAQPLATWALARTVGWPRATASAIAMVAIVAPGIGLVLPFWSPASRRRRSIEPHPFAVVAAELPVDIDGFLSATRRETLAVALDARPSAVTVLRFGQPEERRSALTTAVSVDQPAAWRAVALATVDSAAAVQERAIECIEQRRFEYEQELAALREIEDDGWSHAVRMRDYALSGLLSPRNRRRRLLSSYRAARKQWSTAVDRGHARRWAALAARLALDCGSANSALSIVDSAAESDPNPAWTALRAEGLAHLGRWQEARLESQPLRDAGHELPACVAALFSGTVPPDPTSDGGV